ncbi:MAG: succinate dehydrogenase [Azospira oryzae]|nr:MAG: succinate dehydrogenase [Azospira oryzae]PZP81450.1 MAG: succinate dehydrogenase [Azospira oryzae]
MSARAETVLWLAQRVTGALLSVLVAVHLATMIYAVQNGLTAAEILGRTRGSPGWATFYGLFVVAVAVHAPIGLRNVIAEWTAWRGPSLGWAMLALAVLLALLGFRAVWAVAVG